MVAVWAVPSIAQTPDGETPAVETVCDPLKGATPGLYGLCVAYCEAQDCDSDQFLSGQCDSPNPKVLANYDKKKREGDPNIPCILPPPSCPCFDAAKLGELGLVSCRVLGDSISLVGDRVVSRDNAGWRPANTKTGAPPQCNFANFDGSTVIESILEATDPEQAVICKQILLDYAAANGFPCP